MEIDFVCRVCGKSRHLEWIAERWLAEKVSDTSDPVCDACADAEEEKRIRLEMSGHASDFAIKAGVPEKFIEWDKTKGNNELLKFILRNIHRNLFIADKNDQGKTRALCLAVRKVLTDDYRKKVVFWNVNELVSAYVDEIKNGRSDAFKNRLKRMDLVVLDDFGKKFLSEAGGDLIYTIVNGLYERSGIVWMSANRMPNELKKYFQNDEIFDAVFSKFGRNENEERSASWLFGKIVE